MKISRIRSVVFCVAGIGLAYLAWIRFDRSVEINQDFRVDGLERSDIFIFNAFVIGDWKFRRETWCHVAEYAPPYSLYVTIEPIQPGTRSIEFVRAQIKKTTGDQEATDLNTVQVAELSTESSKKTFCFKNAILFHEDFNLHLEYRTSVDGQTKTEQCSLRLRAIESRDYNSLFLRRLLY